MFHSGNGSSSQPPRNNSGYPLYPISHPYPELDQEEEDVTNYDYTNLMREDGRFDLPDLPLPNRPFVFSDQRSNSDTYLNMNDDLPLMPQGPESRSYSLDSYPVPPPRRNYPPSLSIPPPLPPPHSRSSDNFGDGNPLTPPMHYVGISMPEPQPYQPNGGGSYTPFNSSPTAAHTGFLENSPQPPPHAIPTQQGSFASIPGSFNSNPNSPTWRKPAPPSPTNAYPPPPMLGESSAQNSQGSLDLPTINRGPHYGLAPKRQLRRYRTKRKIQLKNGHLVLDCPAPTKLLQSCQLRDHEEFTHMRYTAATCDPDNFMKDNYDLRQKLYGRRTELFIVVTMYNEDEILFTRTMHGVMKNIAHLVSRKKSKTWGDDGWKKVVVCIVADGRKKCNPRVLSVLAGMGVYQDGIAKNIVNGKEVTAHIYEYTSQVSIEPDNLKIKGSDKGIVPCQILFCLKERNQKKLNSHRWFFNAFAPILKPNICVLLDVGTRPGNTSIYHLWKAFDLNPNIGGACGEIRAMTGMGGTALLNPLVAAQNFEYKMSNILDKPLESVFGYISVLPGAFSAYRFTALTPDRLGNGPLTQYFKGENQHGSETDVFTANMYLAEDRILCYELVSKKNEAWVLHYVKSAFGETDVPDAVPEFISQRRRWLNGSFFAAIYSLYHFPHIWRSDHSFWRKISLHIEFMYNFVSLIFSWLAMGNFYISFYYIAKSLADPAIDPFMGHGDLIFEILRYLYYFLIIVQFILSMGNRPQGSKWSFTLSMVFFAIIMGYMLFAAGYLTYQTILFATSKLDGQDADSVLVILFKTPGFRDVIVSLAGTYGLYFVVSFMYLDPWHMGTSFIQYMFLLPSYINTLNIYAFCNTHDVSWGTKGDTTISTDLGVAKSAGSKQGVETVEVELPTEEVDINEAYEEALADMRKRVEKKHQKRDAKTKQEDYYRSFRTQLVLWWIACNAMLIGIVTAQEFENIFISQATGANLYLSVIMWTVAGLALFRFLGSSLYLLIRFLTDG